MKKTIFLLIISLFFCSCEVLFMKPEPENTPTSVFNQIWEFSDKKYSFFEYKNIDWDKIKVKYQTKINDKMTEEELFYVCADMLGELKDGHVNIKSDFDYGRNWTWFLNYPQNFNYNFLERNYFKSKEQLLDSFTLFDFGDVLYMYYGDFTTSISKENMDYLIEKLKNKKGLIIDIRGNGGGAVINVDLITQRFINKDISIGTSWVKSGPNREDFTEEAIELKYDKKLTTNDKIPIVLLTNRSCYSSASFFTLYMKTLPQVTVIGDKTGGGGGIPAMGDLTNGWQVRVSSSRTFDNSGFNIENGIDPHIKVDWSKSDENQGKDTILERGLAFLRK